MCSVMSAGRGKRDSWACCLSPLLSRLLIFFWGGGGTESEWLSLAASDNSMISFCLHLRYSPRVWIIFTTRHWYNLYQRIPCFQRTKRLHIYLPCHITVRLHLTLQLGVIRDLFSPRAFVPQQCLCPTVQGPRDSVCVFIFLNRKQRNGSESEYTEKLQQYSKSLR